MDTSDTIDEIIESLDKKEHVIATNIQFIKDYVQVNKENRAAIQELKRLTWQAKQQVVGLKGQLLQFAERPTLPKSLKARIIVKLEAIR
jgi:hypothetical protein